MAIVIHIQPDGKVPRYEGILRPYIIPPDMSDMEFVTWWKRLPLRERERHYLGEYKNTITDNGLAAINAFLGSQGNSANVPGFAQYFAVGINPINGVDPSDTVLANEIFRKIPVLVTIIGNVTVVSTKFLTTEANYTYTNAGLWGGASCSSTLNSGILMTHVPYPTTKTSAFALGNDYSIERQ